MEISINARHCSVPDSIRNQTQIRLERLARFNPGAISATANFSAEGGQRQLELRLLVKGAAPLVGQGSGATFRTALDLAVARLERQLKRRNERHRNRRPRTTPRAGVEIVAA